MRFTKRLPVFLMILLVLPLLFGMTFSALSAQSGDTIISLAIPEWWQSGYSVNIRDILAEFEAANPGVKVVIKYHNGLYYYLGSASPDDIISDYLDSAEDLASTADVAYISYSSLSPEATRAGYFLDLAPLTSGDASLDESDFHPAAWAAFQWDRGVWAIPAAMTPLIVVYNPARFDELGLPYPNEFWTLQDYVDAIQALARFDANGETELPGLAAFGPQMHTFLYSFVRQPLYDSATVPNAPIFDVPGLAEVMTTWSALQATGALDFPLGGFDWAEIPMRIDNIQVLGSNFDNIEWAGALMPGGLAAMDAHAFAVSGGTAAPEAAYALANFLSRNGDMMQYFWGARPARQSLIGTYEDQSDDFIDFTDEEEALIDRAFESLVPLSEVRFYNYIEYGLQTMRGTASEPGVDAQTVLNDLQTQAEATLQIADARRTEAVFEVATPVPTPILGQGEVALNFNLQSYVSPLPNRDLWDQVIAEFVANDPEVRQITLNTGFGSPEDESNDCLFTSYNNVQVSDLSIFLSLDPFLNADPNFDPNDFFAGILPQMQRENRTWGYPLVIFPEVMWYDSASFQEVGAIEPLNGWTIEQFSDAVRALRLSPEGDAPFIPNTGGNSYLLMLMAAFGGLPLDYTTNPPTRNFTDPATIDAIRQVLDLAKAGYIKYTELGQGFGGGGGWAPNMQIPIFNDMLQPYSVSFSSFEGSPNSADSPYRLTTYPVGSRYTPVSYNIGMAYINPNTQYPEACYRFITTLAAHPELFNGMPARISMLDHPLLAESQSPKLLEHYRQFGELLAAPNIVVIPSSNFGGTSSAPGFFFWQMWLNGAFDNYVLRNGDLEADLATAEANSATIDQCLAALPQFDESWTAEEMNSYSRQFRDCAVSIDPALANFFGPIGDEEE